MLCLLFPLVPTPSRHRGEEYVPEGGPPSGVCCLLMQLQMHTRTPAAMSLLLVSLVKTWSPANINFRCVLFRGQWQWQHTACMPQSLLGVLRGQWQWRDGMHASIILRGVEGSAAVAAHGMHASIILRGVEGSAAVAGRQACLNHS